MMILLIFKNYCLFSVCHHSSEVARWAHMSIFRFATGLIIIIYLIKNHSTQSIKTKIEHLFLVHLHAHIRMLANFSCARLALLTFRPALGYRYRRGSSNCLIRPSLFMKAIAGRVWPRLQANPFMHTSFSSKHMHTLSLISKCFLQIDRQVSVTRCSSELSRVNNENDSFKSKMRVCC